MRKNYKKSKMVGKLPRGNAPILLRARDWLRAGSGYRLRIR